jgi:hypothetical protein
MVATIRDPDLFQVGNQFTHDMDIKRLGINPLVKRCGINPAIWFLVVLIMMSKATFVSTGSIPIGMDKYNKKIMVVTIRDPDLFRVEN